MVEHRGQSVLIVGAGSVGIIIGYHLSLAGAAVTFLIRPHREEQLKRPQTLYSYDDHQLKTFKEYAYITDPSKVAEGNYDYIVVTLDGAALRNEVGQALVKKIGDAARGTKTRIIIFSVSLKQKSWFLQESGLGDEQVTGGMVLIHIYPPQAVKLPLHAPTNPELLAQADQAYTDCLGPGLMVDDSSPSLAKDFADLYNGSGVSTCVVTPEVDAAVMFVAFFPAFAAAELLGWPRWADIDIKSKEWTLAVEAVKEVQGLSMHGDVGQKAAAATTGASVVGMLADLESKLAPLDAQAFNRYHHGGKVNRQDVELLTACIAQGEADGKPLSALKDLVQRLEKHHG